MVEDKKLAAYLRDALENDPSIPKEHPDQTPHCLMMVVLVLQLGLGVRGPTPEEGAHVVKCAYCLKTLLFVVEERRKG